MNVIFLGPPGTGKGTQAERISQYLGIVHISTGEIFRQLADEGNQLGVEARDKYWGKSKLVPDDVTIKLVEERFKKDDWKKGFILDGFPRTVPQAEALENMVNIDYVIDIESSDAVIIARLTARRQCRSCKKIYGLDVRPLNENVCDACGGDLYQRSDDNEKIIMGRLKEYELKTKPLIAFYQSRGLLKIVDGEQPIDNIKEDILKILGKKA